MLFLGFFYLRVYKGLEPTEKGISMISEIKGLVKSTVNPVSGKPESEECRVKDIFESEGDIVIKYDREGLSPGQKRIFEDNILSVIKDKVPVDKVSFSSFSKDSGDVYKSLN